MPNLNQKLISVLGKTMASALVIFSAHCGSLIKELKCIDERTKGIDDKTDSLSTDCAKPVAAKFISSSPSDGSTNVSISNSNNRILFEVENGNKAVLDPVGFTISLSIDNNAPVFFPNSSLSVVSNPSGGKNGRYWVQINTDNAIFNQTNPNNPLNLPYGSVIKAVINNADFSETITFTVGENPAGLADIDNDYSIVEVVTTTQIRLRNVINNYAVKYINLTGVLPATDYVYSHIEGNKLFLLRDIGTNTRLSVGDPISNGHQVIEIDLPTGNLTTVLVPSQNIPIFNVMESIINAHQGPTTTVTTATPPADFRIYPVVRRNHITNGAGGDLVIRMQYFGGETQEIVVAGAFTTFDGAFPVISQRLSNNTYIVMAEPGRLVKLTFDYNSAAAWGSKVSVTPTVVALPLTIPNALAGEYVLGNSIVEDKNTPGQFLVLYSDISSNRFVAKFDVNGNIIGRIQVPNSVIKIISFTSQSPENALGFYHNGTNQVEVRSGQNFGAATLGAIVYSYLGNLQVAVLPPIVSNPTESAGQTLDMAEIGNKTQPGSSTVNLTLQRIEKFAGNGTLSSFVDISGFITTLKTNLGTVNDPNDAKVIEQGNNYILILKVNDGVRERVAVLDLAASAPTWISPAGSDCEMVYGAGKFNSGTDRLLVLYHLVGSPNYVITDGVTTYTTALGGASVNTMIILDPNFTNGTPTQMKVAVGKSNGLQLLTFNKASLVAPVSNTTILNNLVAAIGADVNNGNVLSLQVSFNSDDDGATPTFYALNQVLKGGQLKQMLFTLNTAGTITPGFLEWNVASKDMQGSKRLTDGRFLMTDLLGRTYVMDATGGTYRTFHNNMRRGNIFR